jgi:hypothetical protein
MNFQPKDNCKHCGYPITWADQKYTFAKLLSSGYDKDTIKLIGRSHLKCAKKFIKEQNIAKTQVKP